MNSTSSLLTLTCSARRLYFSRTSQLELECYYCGESEIGLTTDEREEFERGSGLTLDSDIIPADQFAALLSFVLASR